MKGVFGFTLVILAGLLAAAQEKQPPQLRKAQTCPVHIDKWGQSNYGYGPSIGIKYINVSNKLISAVIFEAYSVDALGEKHDLLVTPQFTITYSKHPLKPGKRDTGNFDNSSFDYQSAYGMWVYGVRFADGVTWKDDGSRSCVLVSTY